MKVFTKFKVDTTICWLVIALLLLMHYVTWWPWPFTFLTLVSAHTWRVTWSNPLRSLKFLRISVLELRVLTSPIGYHWKCVCSHCACAVSRDLCLGGKFFPHIWNPWPRFAYSLTFMALLLRQMELSPKTMYGPVLKSTCTALCACAKSRQHWTLP